MQPWKFLLKFWREFTNHSKTKETEQQRKKSWLTQTTICFLSMLSKCRGGHGQQNEEPSRSVYTLVTMWFPSLPVLSRHSAPLTSSGSPETRVISLRDRLNIIKQCVLRNEHFAPSTLPSRDRERLVTVSQLLCMCDRTASYSIKQYIS